VFAEAAEVLFPIKTTDSALHALALTLIELPMSKIAPGTERYPIVALPTLNTLETAPIPLANVPV
jgi:hypothetical protein